MPDDKAMQTIKTKDNVDRNRPAEAQKDWQRHGPLKSSPNDCIPSRTALSEHRTHMPPTIAGNVFYRIRMDSNSKDNFSLQRTL
jgi:hypothetical protein